MREQVINIAYDHPDIDAAYERGEALPSSHPKVSPMMSNKLPAGHPNVDELLANPSAHPLPSWHPRLNDMVERRSFWSPGIIFSLILASAMFIHWVLRVSKRSRT